MMHAAAGIFLAAQRRRGVKYIDGIDNNAVPFNFTASTGMFDNAAVIDTGVLPNLSIYVKYSAYFYPIGSRTDGYVTGVYFGSQSGDDSYDSFWVRAFVPRSEGSSNLQARIGRYSASGFYSFDNSILAFHVFELSKDGFFVDGVKKYSPGSIIFSPPSVYPIFLGGSNLGGRCWRAYRQILTDVVIRNSDGVDMHLVPAKTRSGVGMVDVNNDNAFYGSSTGIAFSEHKF